jgi:hypothetical protein
VDEEPEPLLPRARQRERLHEPRAPSIDRCSLRAAFAVIEICENPPPICRLSHQRVGFRRAFAFRCSRIGRLDLPIVPRAHRTRLQGPHAAYRLLQPNQPASTTTDRPNPAHRTDGRPSTQLLFAGGYAGPKAIPFRGRHLERGQPRRHGSEVPHGHLRPAELLPPQSLVMGTSPQPNRLGHLIVASS